ncbi:PREDICTED: DAZ-associated protein 2-like isoform X1 [Vollenhovia emeryi]|uniref:DAZ-associated protein 2-like isoform X1 n=1 Tax=Vollenhovia emeryi TaxID=411798 RepID=UPI0005F4F3FE|nr:PREDICTED: DAZ-associated protein 2-like isoform X1 [Vollenhovia emeryi]
MERDLRRTPWNSFGKTTNLLSRTPYPVAPHPPTGFVPAPTQPPTYGVAGASPYGVFPNQPQLYATQGPPPPTYDQTLAHPMMYQPMYGQGYPLQYYPPGYPLQYYPPLAATTAYYPAMQPAPVRPTIMVPNGFDGTRFDGISQPVLPPPPPGVAANAAQLAAMAGHSVALSQKKGSFLGGGTEGGYTFW